MALALDGSAHANGSGTSIGASLTTANANDVIVVICLANGADLESITDDAGLTWTKITEGGGSNKIDLWYAIAASALTSNTITCNFSVAASFSTLDVFGISGANTSSPFDADASTPANGTTSELVVSTDTADCFIIGGYRMGTANPTAGSGWTLISGANFQLAEYKIVSSPQTDLVVDIGTGAGGQNGGVADAIVIADDGGGEGVSIAALARGSNIVIGAGGVR